MIGSRCQITSARWLADDGKLAVRATRTDGVAVTVGNADDPTQIIRTDRVFSLGTSWSIAKIDPGPIPCRVLAVSSDGGQAEMDVNPAPSGCGPKGPPDPTNAPPVADAGPDQSLTLAVGQPTMERQLDGTASTDADGQVVSWSWSGTPDPRDVERPRVTPPAGQCSFDLIVTDDHGEASATDSVGCWPERRLR
jgi:hypothetical protein